MQALERFEGFVERLMEGSFARLFRSPIQPAEIAKRLEREMEAHPTISVGRTYVPNHYEVTLHKDDYAEFEPFRHSLEHQMAEFISDLAAERGYSLVARPTVLLQPGEGVPKRSIEVQASLTDPPAMSALEGVRRGDQAPGPYDQAPAFQQAAQGQGLGQPAPQAATIDLTVDRTHAMPRMPRRQAPAEQAAPPYTAVPRASLQPLAGDMANRSLQLTKTLISIGRGLDNDLVIDDPRVSRHHSQITFRHSHYLLRDLRSTNGTFHNGQPIETVVLAPGDMVSFGGFEMMFMQE